MVPFLIYAVVAAVVFSFFGKTKLLGLGAGIITGGALYLLITVVMVKFGWNPPSWSKATASRDAGRPPSAAAPSKPRSPATGAPRGKPAPTRRTNASNRQPRPH